MDKYSNKINELEIFVFNDQRKIISYFFESLVFDFNYKFFMRKTKRKFVF